MSKFGVFFLLVLILGNGVAIAKPEYAVKQNVSCVACHLNPWGGGPRNVYGKIYGSKNFDPSKISQQDTYAASLRGIAYYPKDIPQNANGLALMEASASANIVPVEGGENNSEIRVVGTYNFSPLKSGLRETYARVTSQKDTYIVVGRFNPPFGLFTDEHRTYTKMQTNMGLNTFVTGGALSGIVFPKLFYDFAVVTDLQGNTGFSAQGAEYGVIGTLRWQPDFLPILLGISQNYQQVPNIPEPYATAGYLVFSFDRFTEGKLPASFLFEAVTAQNWNGTNLNSALGPFFIPSIDSAYQDAINLSRSVGFYTMIRYDISPRWNIFYKWDSLTLDNNYFGDVFLRSGLGVEVSLNSNTYLNMRVERADVTKSEISSSQVLGNQSAFLAMLRLWL